MAGIVHSVVAFVGKRLRFSIRGLLLVGAILAPSLTVVVQQFKYHRTVARHQFEMYKLRETLNSTQRLLGELPVRDPERVYVLAKPSYAHGRWAWRVYLPPGSRYALYFDVGSVEERGETRRIVPVPGYKQQFGLRGYGETSIVVDWFHTNGEPHFGISVGQHSSNCRPTPPIARDMGRRNPHREEQAGMAGAEEFTTDEPVTLLMRWYPHEGPEEDGSNNVGPVGYSLRLEPYSD